MFHIAIILSIIALSQCEIGADPDPADVDPLTVLIREVKERMRQLSQDIDKDIHVLEQKRKKNVSKHDDFPHPKPLFEGIFTPEQLAKIEKSGSELKQARNIDHRAKLMVDRLLFLNERGVDITGPAGGYHRSLGGGYLGPHQYEPSNVHWYSYRDEGRAMNQIDEFGRVIV